MSYRELTMIEIKEVLRRWQAGHSVRKIGRDTSVGRKAAARYIHWAVELGVPRDRELRDEDVHAVAQCVQSQPAHDESDERRAVSQHREAIEKWLSDKPPLRLSKVHTLLKRRGLEVSYATVRRFAMQELGWHKQKSTIRLEDPPAGQEAQIDFGRMGHLVDPETGKRRTLWALIVTLSFSRYQFVWPTFRQTTEAICEALDQAWWFFDAVPVTLVPDNMKGIIKKPDAVDAELCDAFLDYVQARNIFVDPARIRRPKDKARVENQVPFARESWFAGEEFRDLDEARQSAAYWSAETAGRRIHGTTRQVPREVFETVEKAAMQPADRASHSTCRSGARPRCTPITTGTELIKVHPRKPPGGRSTDVSDYPTEKQGYALRSVDRVIVQARARGEHVARYAERILAGPLPWARMRAAYALLRLCDKYGPGRVEAVCQSALAFDVIDVRRIKRMLETAARPPARPEAGKATVTQLSLPRFARDAKHFETRPRTTDKDGSK